MAKIRSKCLTFPGKNKGIILNARLTRDDSFKRDVEKTPRRNPRFTHHRPRHVLRGNAREQRHDRSREGVLNRKRVKRRRGVPPVGFAISRVKIRTERREETESEHAVLVPLQRDDDRGTNL